MCAPGGIETCVRGWSIVRECRDCGRLGNRDCGFVVDLRIELEVLWTL